MLSVVSACFMSSLLSAQVRTDSLISALIHHQDNSVLVVSHRGDWRNAPENSLQAIKNCIDMGVDMVEIDLKKTKDGVIILMHDKRIDRTTTGKGLPSDYTYEELQHFYLRNGAGHKTAHKIPTLKEALFLCKDKILVNIDKGYDYFDDVIDILVETGTISQCILKSNRTYHELMKEHGRVIEKNGIIYMPVVDLQKENGNKVLESFVQNYRPTVYEINFDDDHVAIDAIDRVKASGAHVYVNTLWPELCSGHNDDKAVEERNINDSWGWMVDRGVKLIQTDRPYLLLDYLRKKGLHK